MACTDPPSTPLFAFRLSCTGRMPPFVQTLTPNMNIPWLDVFGSYTTLPTPRPLLASVFWLLHTNGKHCPHHLSHTRQPNCCGGGERSGACAPCLNHDVASWPTQ